MARKAVVEVVLAIEMEMDNMCGVYPTIYTDVGTQNRGGESEGKGKMMRWCEHAVSASIK